MRGTREGSVCDSFTKEAFALSVCPWACSIVKQQRIGDPRAPATSEPCNHGIPTNHVNMKGQCAATRARRLGAGASVGSLSANWMSDRALSTGIRWKTAPYAVLLRSTSYSGLHQAHCRDFARQTQHLSGAVILGRGHRARTLVPFFTQFTAPEPAWKAGVPPNHSGFNQFFH